MTAWQQRQHLQQAIARQPGDFVAWVMLADLELEAGDIAAGEQAARHALQLRPNHPEALARLGRVAWMAGAHTDAAKLLGQASALAPQHPGIALWLGVRRSFAVPFSLWSRATIRVSIQASSNRWARTSRCCATAILRIFSSRSPI